jgi:hypothetical protein
VLRYTEALAVVLITIFDPKGTVAVLRTARERFDYSARYF